MSVFAMVLAVHVLIAVLMIGLILIQHGKGADAGAAFGSGASGTVFGSQGSGSFMTRSTAILATAFFITSLTLAYLGANRESSENLVDKIPVTATPEDLINNITIDQGEQPSTSENAPADIPVPE